MISAIACWGPRGDGLRRCLGRRKALVAGRDALAARRDARQDLLDDSVAEEAGALEEGRRQIAANDTRLEEARRRLALQRAAAEAAARRITGPVARVLQAARRVFGGPAMSVLHEAHQQCCAGCDATEAQLEVLALETAQLKSGQATRQLRIDDHRYAVEHLQRILDQLDADIRGLDAEVDRLLEAILLETPDALWEQRLRHLSAAGLVDAETEFLAHLARVRDHGEWQASLPRTPPLPVQSGDIGTAVTAGLIPGEHVLQGEVIVNGGGHHHRYHHGKNGGWRRHAVTFHGRLSVRAGFAARRWRHEAFSRALGALATEAFMAGFAGYGEQRAGETESRRQRHGISLAWFRDLLERCC